MALALSAPSLAYNPLVGDFTKERAGDLRIMSYNTERNFIADATRDAAFHRILNTVKPDIIVMQEIRDELTTTQIAQRLQTVLPYSSVWWVFKGKSDGTINTIIASRYALSGTLQDTVPASSTRGVTIGMVDLPAGLYPTNIYLLGVHLKCCDEAGDNDNRQRSADAIASWLGNARTTGGTITIPGLTPMLVLGDFNLVGGPQPETTLITGDIIDNATYGADIFGDWDESIMLDVRPTNPINGDPDTWSSDFATPISRLDRFLLTDSVATVAHGFILNTLTMNATQLAGAGLQSQDTTSDVTADHLPIVMDLRLPGTLGTLFTTPPVPACDATITTIITDQDLNGATATSATATVMETGQSLNFSLALTINPNTYVGSFRVSPTPVAGRLTVTDGSTVRVRYADANAGPNGPQDVLRDVVVECGGAPGVVVR